jgi:hypothetical protein
MKVHEFRKNCLVQEMGIYFLLVVLLAFVKLVLQ